MKRTNKRYILIGLLFLHTVNTYMDRICISAAASDIKTDLNIDNQMIGYIFGIFALGYALFQIPAGWFADVYGPRKALTVVVAFWSSFTALTGAAWNALSMLIIRFLFGVGEAGAFPGATRAFFNWIPAKERGIANGIFHSGARAGAALSLVLIPWMIGIIGWRMTFVVNGIIGILWAIAWLIWFKNHPRENKNVNTLELEYIEKGIIDGTKKNKNNVSIWAVLTSNNMLLAMFQYIASNITFFISFTWLLPYLVDRWGKDAGVYAPIPLLIGMVAHWISGGLSTLLYERGFKSGSRSIPAIVGFSISVIGLLLCVLSSGTSPLTFVLLFSIAVFGVEMTVSPSWAFCMDIGGENSGTVSATMNMFGNIGSAISAIIFPYFVAHVTIPVLVEKTGSANSFFLLAAVINILAIVAWFFMNPNKKIDFTRSKESIKRRIYMIAIPLLLVFLATLILKIFYF